MMVLVACYFISKGLPTASCAGETVKLASKVTQQVLTPSAVKTGSALVKEFIHDPNKVDIVALERFLNKYEIFGSVINGGFSDPQRRHALLPLLGIE